MNIRRCHRHFDVSPLVVPADTTTTIEIRPRQEQCVCEEYEITAFPMDGYGSQGGWQEPAVHTVKTGEDGIARIDLPFDGEQEHMLQLTWKHARGRVQEEEFRIYSVRDDLLGRRPYKGDLHLHSFYSDGNSTPAYVAGACRRVGFDFMALTDHGMYGPSQMVIKTYEDLPIDLQLYPGEEVHAPHTRTHILNIGGEHSVNDLYDDEATYTAELAAIRDGLGDLPAGVNPDEAACCLWVFEKIRAAGGLSVFCHPFWIAGRRYHPGMPLTEYLFDSQPFAAYEVIGGYGPDCDSNTLQVELYNELRAAGKQIPIVGVSDAHGCDGQKGGTFGWQYTIAFAESPERADVITAIKDCYSVAMEFIPTDRPRPTGPLRLGKLALFCEREIFPMHDELCVEEGRLMQAHQAGDASAVDALAGLQGRTAALYDRLWGGS